DGRGVGRLTPLEVVAVEGDVEVADRDLGAGELLDEGMQAAADDRTAGVDSDQRQPTGIFVLLDDLVGDPDQRPPQIVVIEHDLLVVHLCAPSWPRGTGLKGLAGASVAVGPDRDWTRIRKAR